MAISLSSIGSFVAGVGSTITPSASFVAGQQIIIFTGEFRGSQTISTPAGWQNLDANINALQVRCFGLTSATGAESMPGITWGTGSIAWAIATVWDGIDPLFDPGANPADRNFNSTRDITGQAVSRTPSVDGCLVFIYGERNKTSTTDGITYSPPSGFTILAQRSPNGSQPSCAISYQIQTAATVIGSNQPLTGSLVESVTQSANSGLIILSPQGSNPPPPPPDSVIPSKLIFILP